MNKEELITIQVEDVLIGRIYMIYNVKDEFIYIGSTLSTLSRRWSQHISAMKYTDRLHTHMRVIGFKNFRIKLLEWKQVQNEKELKILEQLYLNKYDKNILLNDNKAIK